MRAIRIHEHGGPEAMRLDEVPDPVPGPGEVLVEVGAAGINHLDVFVRRGMPGVTIPLPRILGADAAGVVAVLGDGVTAPAVGTRVLLYPATYCGACDLCESGDASMCGRYRIYGEHADGTYAEKVVARADNAIPIPDGWTFAEAASVPLVFVTAWRMLITRGRLKPGEDVLILGAGSGVGSACVQIARLVGARVWATASSEEKQERARALGAEVIVPYERFDKFVRDRTGRRGVDVVVDYVGKDTWTTSLRALRQGGRILTCGATTGFDPTDDLRHIFFRQLEVIGSTMGSRTELKQVLKHLFDGRLRAVVDRVVPLAQAAEAHRLIEARQVFGKVVLDCGTV